MLNVGEIVLFGHRSTVFVGETMYSSREQAYRHEYAVEAGDDVTAQVILEAQDGYECKKLAMRIQTPHPDWTNKKEAIMKTVLNLHKMNIFANTSSKRVTRVCTRLRAICFWACGVGLHRLGRLLQTIRQSLLF